VLVVDADAQGASIYRAAFQSRGCEVESAVEEDTGFALAKKFQPEIVVLDLKLARGSGLGLLRRIRASGELRGITVVVCSSNYVSSALDDAWKAGADLVITRMDHPPKEVAELALQQAARTAALGGQEAIPRPKANGFADPAKWKADRSRIHAAAAPVSVVRQEQATGPGPGKSKCSPIRSTPEAEPPGARFELAREFLTQAPAALHQLRQELKSLALPDGRTVRLDHLYKLHALAHSFACGAAFMGLTNVSRTSWALKDFLTDLASDLNRITEARVRLLAHGIDLIATQTALVANPGEDWASSRVLVICNEEFSRHALAAALAGDRLCIITARSAEAARELMEDSSYGLIVVDYEDLREHLEAWKLCQSLRGTRGHADTPILLIHNGPPTFEAQQHAALSNANDAIDKPFLESELRLRAWCLIAGQNRRSHHPPGAVTLEV
jgi:DNA-binding response OmpR family regulator